MGICAGAPAKPAISRFITFNGKGFDIPTLIHRAAIHGIRPADSLLRAANAKPWEADLHVDMASAFRFGAATGRYSLEAFALAYGMANPKADGDGSKLGTFVEQQDAVSLFQYVMGDVVTTAKLYERWQSLGLVP
jgi:DNA polymerase elongation subunit (family B)